jgi:NhaP-type Na+/H+ or K+/H+ antiporter
VTEPVAGVLLAVVVIAVSTILARRLRIAGPLILTAVGLAAGWLPFLPPIDVDPEFILVGVLPPLLYAAAVRLPAVEFRRDFRPIAGLAVLLVVVSALVLGAFFWAMIPELEFPLAVALGAILSPTDAVATSIVKRLGISPRVVTMLEGESLLNDATSLVLLRSAVAAVAAGFAFWDTVGSFLVGVAVAVVLGAVVGYLALRLRQIIADTAAATAVGFVVPFAAYLPTEHLGGSGLVASVVAGLTVGQGALRRLTAEQRISDELNWRTVELVLEGAVFLLMGLELRAIFEANMREQNGPGRGLVLAVAALAIVLLVRAAYVSLVVLLQGRRAKASQRERLERIGDRLDAFEGRLDEIEAGDAENPTIAGRTVDPDRARRRAASMRTRLRKSINDLDYYQATPLGWKHGTVIVWAGMRGVVTLAAAQTLPRETPARELLILVAFLVAVGSLLLQGLTLPWLVRVLRIPRSDDGTLSGAEERERLRADLTDAATSLLDDPDLARASGEPYDPDALRRAGDRAAAALDDDRSAMLRELRIATIEAMRARLVELSGEGSYSSAALRQAREELDAEQLAIQLRSVDDGDDL